MKVCTCIVTNFYKACARLVRTILCTVLYTAMDDCNTPLAATGVIIEPFSNTKFGALITFHCEESESLITGVCGVNGEWEPDPASLECEQKIPGNVLMYLFLQFSISK